MLATIPPYVSSTSHVLSGLQIILWALGTCCASVCCKALGAHVSWFELLSHCHNEAAREQSLRLPLGLVCARLLRMGGEWSKEEQESRCIREHYFGVNEWPVQGVLKACNLSFSHNSACTDWMLQPRFKCKLQIYLR